MKKEIVVIILLFSVFSTLSSQNVDGGANAILDNLSKKYKQFTSMKIQYTFKSEKDKKVLGRDQGSLVIKGSKYRMELASQLICCDAKNIWNYQKESNEISIFEHDPTDETNIMNPTAILTNWQKEYTAKFIREEVENNRTLQIIDLKPFKTQSYYKIRLFIDKHKNEIFASSIYEKDNTIYSYYINEFISNAVYEDSFFVLDLSKYPDAEIIDMR